MLEPNCPADLLPPFVPGADWEAMLSAPSNAAAAAAAARQDAHVVQPFDLATVQQSVQDSVAGAVHNMLSGGRKLLQQVCLQQSSYEGHAYYLTPINAFKAMTKASGLSVLTKTMLSGCELLHWMRSTLLMSHSVQRQAWCHSKIFIYASSCPILCSFPELSVCTTLDLKYFC